MVMLAMVNTGQSISNVEWPTVGDTGKMAVGAKANFAVQTCHCNGALMLKLFNAQLAIDANYFN